MGNGELRMGTWFYSQFSILNFQFITWNWRG